MFRIPKTQRHITQYIKEEKVTKGNLAFSSCLVVLGTVVHAPKNLTLKYPT